uniref:Uncharacterized protein n=1 Tax=Parascaris equorum TaxID=6256 RepID=A0A914RXE8_PAREQ
MLYTNGKEGKDRSVLLHLIVENVTTNTLKVSNQICLLNQDAKTAS